ncbi:hypothetical protein NQZ68_013376 [Dissostichus eleginoides]|nr:hypothetical protein NQZ68_013376 [Dissostichus eleginoides]
MLFQELSFRLLTHSGASGLHLTEMRGAAMSLTAAASGLVVFLLSVSVVQGQDGWGVTYTSTEICAVKGSTVEINCSYKYPSTWKGGVNTVEETFWVTKWKYLEFVDLTTDSEYAGRVEDLCENNICTLRIRNLTESDSDQYRFRFITNQDAYWGNPGTTLSVTDLQVEVSRSGSSTLLQCLSSCPPGHTSYIWSKNRQEVKEDTSPYADFTYDAPKPPSVSVSPSAEIEEGSSVTLTCSSDANPAANYTWYKKNEDSPKASGQIFNITDFRAEHSGSYSCGAQNKLGRSNSTLHLSVVAVSNCYAAGRRPQEVRKHNEEGDKNRHILSKIMTFCGAFELALRGHDETLQSTIFGGLVDLVSSLHTELEEQLKTATIFKGMSKTRKRASRDSSEPEERADNREECVPDQPEQQDDLQYASVHFSNNRADPLYSNMRAAQPLGHTEQQEVSEYAAVKFSSAAPRTRGQDSEEDPAALYSTVNKSR